MNKPLTLFSAIVFSSLLAGTATASPDDITMDVIDPDHDSVTDVTRHIELRDEDHRSDEANEHAQDEDHRKDDEHEADDDRDEHKDDMDDEMDDSKDEMEDSKDEMEDNRQDTQDEMHDSRDDS